MRSYWVLLLPCLLTGCFIPPAVSLASLVINGASYVTTGKGVADHGISAVAEEDCATWRVIKGEDICQPNDDPELALAMALEPGDLVPTPVTRPQQTVGGVSSAMLKVDRERPRFYPAGLPALQMVTPAAGIAQPRRRLEPPGRF